MTLVIGINGYKRAGKGEAGAALAALCEERFLKPHVLGFADKLKILAAKTLGFKDLHDEECIALMDAAKEKWLIDLAAEVDGSRQITRPIALLTGRQFLQNLGNEARNVFGEDFWVDQVLPKPTTYTTVDNAWHGRQRVSARYSSEDVVIFTDLRYENEAQRIKSLGGLIFEVTRPDTDSDGHASEQPLPRGLIDWTIKNSGSLENLRWRVEGAAEKFGVIPS